MHEHHRREGRQHRQRQRDVHRARQRGRNSQQQQRRDAAGAEQLRCHHPIDIRRPTQDAQQADRHHQQDESSGDQKKLSHRGSPARG